jgi:uncharacterized membrane protein YgcG
MDAATYHFVAKDNNHVREDVQFFGGVIVLQPGVKKPASSSDEKSASSTEEKSASQPAPPALIEAGSFWVDVAEVQNCHACGKPGHLKVDCPTPNVKTRCRRCQQNGHKAADCPTQTARTCHNCGNEGHVAKRCTLPKHKAKCANCASYDHQTSDCTEKCKNCGADPSDPISGHNGLLECPQPDVVAKLTPPKDAAGADDNANKEKEDDDDDNVFDPPRNVFTTPPGCRMDVSLKSLLSPHITDIHVEFRVAYPNPKVATGADCKEAAIRFTKQNLGGTLEVGGRTVNDTELAKWLQPTTLGQLKEHVGESSIQHLKFTFDPTQGGKAGNGDDNRLATGLFSDGTYGPYTELMHAVRDCFWDSASVTVHFFTVGQDGLSDRMQETQACLEDQAAVRPMNDWYRAGKPVIQLGQQLAPSDRPSYKIPAKVSFDHNAAYDTTFFYAAVGDLETVKGQLGFVQTIIRLIEFQPNNHSAFLGLINRVEGLDLPVDGTGSIRFLGPDADSSMDWSCVVVDPKPFSTGGQIVVYLRRPKMEDGRLAVDPVFPPGSIIQLSDYTTASGGEDAFRHAISTHGGIAVGVAYSQPRSNIEREINTLRIKTLRPAMFKTESLILRNNGILAAPVVNLIDRHTEQYGAAKVRFALDTAFRVTNLNPDQRGLEALLRHMRGGIGLVKGGGGTGKSEVAVACAVYFYVLNADDPNPAGANAWMVSPINVQLNDLANRTHAKLMIVYEEAKARGDTWRYPLCVRHHAKGTDKAIYLQGASKARANKGIDCDPHKEAEADAAEDDAAEDVDQLGRLALEFRLREQYRALNSGTKDRRTISPLALSEGQRILDRAGVPDAQGNLHPIHNPDLAKHANFRTGLVELAEGRHIDSDRHEALTRSANLIAIEVALLADVRFMTHHVMSETRQHQASRPSIILHDEAGKANERSELHPMILAKQYWAKDEAGQTSAAADIIPHLLIGDPMQPTPPSVTGDESQDQRPFASQSEVPLFTRYFLGGVSALTLTVQHRFHPQIAAVVNAILPGAPIQSHPSTETQTAELASKAQAHIRKTLGLRDTQFALVSVDGEAQQNPFSKSFYNIRTAKYTVFQIQSALEDGGMKGEDMGVVTAYTAQRALYIDAFDRLEKHYTSLPADDPKRHLAKEARALRAVTMDGIQGQSISFIYIDMVVSDSLRFLRSTARINLAITRAEVGAVVVLNVQGIEVYHADKKGSFHGTAMYKLVCHSKSVKAFRNYQTGTEKIRETLERQMAPFELDPLQPNIHKCAAPPLHLYEVEDDFEPEPPSRGFADGGSAGGDDDDVGGWGFAGGGGDSTGGGAARSVVWEENGTEEDPEDSDTDGPDSSESKETTDNGWDDETSSHSNAKW